jgi:hypothetical protein
MKWLWVLGAVVWLSVLSTVAWRLWNAESFAHASLYSTRLMGVAAVGVIWGIAPAIWQARLRKIRANHV